MPQATRRTVLRNAAWTAPVVTLASAAPAFAGSGATAIAFTPASTRLLTDDDFFGVQFKDAFVRIAPDALSQPAPLTLTVTFRPTHGDDELYSDLTAPPGWAHQARSTYVRNVLVFTYGPMIPTSGATVAFGDGIFFGTDDVAQEGTFVLTFRVGDLVTQWSISTP